MNQNQCSTGNNNSHIRGFTQHCITKQSSHHENNDIIKRCFLSEYPHATKSYQYKNNKKGNKSSYPHLQWSKRNTRYKNFIPGHINCCLIISLVSFADKMPRG